MKIALVFSQSEAHHFSCIVLLLKGTCNACNDVASPPGGDAGGGGGGVGANTHSRFILQKLRHTLAG